MAEVTASRLGKMNGDTIKRISSSTVLLDLNLLRLNPQLLDDREYMQYFVALNNCQTLEMKTQINSELDFPALSAFYKAQAQSILAAVPPYVGLAVESNTAPKQQGSYRLFINSIMLGDYDRSRGAFPFVSRDGKTGVNLNGRLVANANRGGLSKTCPVAATFGLPHYAGKLPTSYAVVFQPKSFAELPLDEATAREYINTSNGGPRVVQLGVDFHVSDQPAQLIQHGKFENEADLDADISRITVVRGKIPNQPIGILYQSGDAPKPAGPSVEPPSDSPQQGPSFGGNPALQLSLIAYLKAGSEMCNWALPAEEKQSIDSFIQTTNRTGNFQAKYRLNMELARARSAVSGRGRLDYCEDAQEHQKFNRRASSLSSGPSSGIQR